MSAYTEEYTEYMWVYYVLQEQQIQKLKNEKLKIAMIKLKEASVQKVKSYLVIFSP